MFIQFFLVSRRSSQFFQLFRFDWRCNAGKGQRSNWPDWQERQEVNERSFRVTFSTSYTLKRKTAWTLAKPSKTAKNSRFVWRSAVLQRFGGLTLAAAHAVTTAKWLAKRSNIHEEAHPRFQLFSPRACFFFFFLTFFKHLEFSLYCENLTETSVLFLITSVDRVAVSGADHWLERRKIALN